MGGRSGEAAVSEQREDGGDAAVDLGLLGQTELGEDGIDVLEVTQVLSAGGGPLIAWFKDPPATSRPSSNLTGGISGATDLPERRSTALSEADGAAPPRFTPGAPNRSGSARAVLS